MSTSFVSAEAELAFLIKKRIKNFWGYGNLNGSTWFIGMEEGLGDAEQLPLERFRLTAYKTVVDAKEHMLKEAVPPKWFNEKAPTQKTWRPLIYILLYQKLGRVPTIEEIRDYQISLFGRTKSDHAILELMPLPAKSLKKSDWLYADIPVPNLTSRKDYLTTYKPERALALKALIEKHQPKLVLFYSRTYLEDWQMIVPKPLIEVIPRVLHIAKTKQTTFAVTAHPTSHGISSSDWLYIAKRVAR